MADEGKLQVAVGAVIKNRDTGNVLLIHRALSQYAGGIWEFPIGRIKQFETFANGLVREVAEETGITSLELEYPLSVFEFMRGDHSADNEVRAVTFATTTSQEDIKLSDEYDDYVQLANPELVSITN